MMTKPKLEYKSVCEFLLSGEEETMFIQTFLLKSVAFCARKGPRDEKRKYENICDSKVCLSTVNQCQHQPNM